MEHIKHGLNLEIPITKKDIVMVAEKHIQLP